MPLVVVTGLTQRIDRVVTDVCTLLHDSSAEARARAGRWVGHVLQDAKRRPWWFLKKRASVALTVGQDIVVLKGDVDRVTAVYGPERLVKLSFDEVTRLRLHAQAKSLPNAGRCSHYAIERANDGTRLHLWPAPPLAGAAFTVMYTRPLDLAIVPDEWETLILNGVIGQFGRHFDRDSLTQDAGQFEQRYERQLRRAAADAWDIDRARGWDDSVPDETAVAASATDTAVSVTVPASLSGIGYVTIETGDYPLVVA